MNLDDRIIKRAYLAICDKYSQKVFSGRLLYSLLGDRAVMSDIMNDFKSVVLHDEKLGAYKKRLKSQSGDVFVFGCGKYAKHMLELMPDLAISGFIDNNIELVGETFKGFQVLSFAEFLDKYKGSIIVISSKQFFFEMYGQLKDAGISDDNIIDGSVLWDIIEGRQYFDLPELPHVDNEGFVDVGSLDGLSCVAFREWNGKEEARYYCFEPDEYNRGKTIRNLEGYHIENYKVFDTGLWDKTGSLLFHSKGMGESRFIGREEAEKIHEDHVLKVPVVKLDDVLAEERITFIKMDIEGSELPALKGAESIIRSQKPKLAISVYHKREDIWEIPEYILNIREDYKLYFRHYCYWATGETVMYAV